MIFSFLKVYITYEANCSYSESMVGHVPLSEKNIQLSPISKADAYGV